MATRGLQSVAESTGRNSSAPTSYSYFGNSSRAVDTGREGPVWVSRPHGQQLEAATLLDLFLN